MAKKTIIKLTEADLHNMIKEAVKKAVKAKEITPSGELDMFGNHISQAALEREEKKTKNKFKKSNPNIGSADRDVDALNTKAKKEDEEYKALAKKGFHQVPMFNNFK